MANMTSDTFSKASGINSEVRDKTQKAEGQLEKFSHDAGSKVGAMASDLAHSAKSYVKNGHAFVKENPVTGVAIAAAAGVAVGSILTMAMRRQH